MKTVIVSPQIPFANPQGDIAQFVDHFLKVVSQDAGSVELLFTASADVKDDEWKPYFKKEGIPARQLVMPKHCPNGCRLVQKHNEIIADALDEIDDLAVVYFADWRGNGVDYIRRLKTTRGDKPVVVSITHGCSAWNRENKRRWPSDILESELEYLERYAVENSDFVVYPSRYSKAWAKSRGWDFSKCKATKVLRHPFMPTIPTPLVKTSQITNERKLEELIFFGEISTQKGVGLFLDAIGLLKQDETLDSLKKITLVGNSGDHSYGSLESIRDYVSSCGLEFSCEENLNAESRFKYFSDRVNECIVVIPSLAEMLGFKAVECSLVHGLNVICADNTAMPEIFGSGAEKQLFEPTPKALAKRIRDYIDHGLLQPDELSSYDYEAKNKGWKAFHAQMLFEYKEKNTLASPYLLLGPKPIVDVCIPFYNLGDYLPQTLDSLAQQTENRFNVYVLDDGSSDSKSRDVFDQLKRKYKNNNWVFKRQDNTGVCIARNNLAQMGDGKFIIWMDSDNVATPKMVGRFLEGAVESGCDLLSCWSFQFKGDGDPRLFDLRRKLPDFAYLPIGNATHLGAISNPFGDMNTIMTREAFFGVGMFSTDHPNGANSEDHELFARMSLQGYKVDTIPEYLYFYRILENSRLRSAESYKCTQRSLSAYSVPSAFLDARALSELVLGVEAKSAEYKIHLDYLGGENYIDHLSMAVTFDHLLSALCLKVKRRLFRNRA